MSLTRKFLTALGVEAEKIDEIINAHAETVEALKEERDKYKTDAEALPDVRKELEDLKKYSKNEDAYKLKYEALKEDFDKYKADIETKQTRAEKENAYRELLKNAGVSDKRIDSIVKISSETIDGLELENGKAKNAKDLVKAISEEWSDFIVKETKVGANTNTPPANNGGATMTKEEILKIKDTTERQKAMAENRELFGI